MQKLQMTVTAKLVSLVLLSFAIHLQSCSCFGQGSLTPPGAPAPTMKSLDQIEPRTPISSLPFSISQSGSYYVTTNLVCTNASAGISIFTSDVTLDLNGYTLKGAGPATYGIFLFNATNVVIRNGTLRDWPQDGVFAFYGRHTRLENLRVFNCGGTGLFGGTECEVVNCYVVGSGSSGISVFDGSQIRNCYATSNSATGISGGGTGVRVEKSESRGNGGGGIVVGADGIVKDCIADFNGAGISAGSGSVVEGCTSTRSSGAGITVQAQCRLVNSTTFSNAHNGIALGPASSAQGCISAYNQYGFLLAETATATDCTTRSNSNHGFVLSTASRALNCLAQGNGLPGFSCESSNAVVDGCQSVNNQIGILAGPGNLIIRNYARSNLISFSISSGSMSGPIISFGSGASGAGIITNANPWANFAY